jgi:diguanylate cyclase (GGDEF)-like protein
MKFRQRALRIPFTYLLLIAVAGIGLTAVLLQYDLNDDIVRSERETVGQVQAVSQDLNRSFATFYSPTVAGEGFASATAQEALALGSTESQLLDDGFAAFALPFVDYLGPALLDYQLAPDGIVTYSARPVENAAAIGHNLFLDDARRDDVLAAVEDRQPIVSGPIELRQGGQGLIIRKAIFVPEATPFSERFTARAGIQELPTNLEGVPEDFWGFATTVIDVGAFVEAIDLAGLSPVNIGLQPVRGDGTLGPSILGTFTGGTSRDVVSRIVLPDGTEWQLTAQVPQETVWGHLDIALIGLILTLLIMAFAAWIYRASKRYRLGYTFGDEISHLTTRREVLEATSRFLSTLYPRLTGMIDAPGAESLHVSIPPDLDDRGIRGDGERHSWSIEQGGETRATIRVQCNPSYLANEVGDVIGTISRILGATLSSLEYREELERQTKVDQLTDLFNRRHFQPSFEDLSETATKRGLWLAVGVVDVDDFKGINDSFGHLFGDEILKELGNALGNAVRGNDTVFRFGGDEFVVLALLESEDQALGLFTRVQSRANAAISDMTPDGRPATISVGYACCPGSFVEPMNELLAKADQALYRAKAAGRNRVEDWTLQGATTGPIAPVG